MTDSIASTGYPQVDELIRDMIVKLRSNSDSLDKAKSGRIDWRWTKDGMPEIKVHPKF